MIVWLKILFPVVQLRQEKVHLEQTLEQEQEHQVGKLMKKIDRLEKEVLGKQETLEQVINMCTYLSSLTWVRLSLILC